MNRLGLLCVWMLILPHAIWCKDKNVVVIGHVSPATDETGIKVRLDGIEVDCVEPETSTVSMPILCQFTAPVGHHTALVILESPGYKRLSVNLAEFVVGGDAKDSSIDIGNVTLVPSELPNVEAIVRARDAGGVYQFRIVLHNRFKRKFLITQILLVADNRKPETNSCIIGVIAEYKVENKLNVTSTDKGTSAIVGSFSDLTDKKKYLVTMEGHYLNEHCTGMRGELLSLAMPSEIPVPPDDYTYLAVDIPSTLEMVPTNGMAKLQGSVTLTAVSLNRFPNIEFRFRTSDSGELDFGGTEKAENQPPFK